MEGLWIASSLIGLTILGNVITTIISKVLEYNREIKSKVLESAYKEWEVKVKMISEQAIKTGVNADLVPFADYVLYYSIYNEKLLKSNITEKDIDSFYEDYDKLYKIFDKKRKEIKAYDNKVGNKP